MTGQRWSSANNRSTFAAHPSNDGRGKGAIIDFPYNFRLLEENGC